jgi:ATP-dependent Clp protease ATP-binding subunit ClpC
MEEVTKNFIRDLEDLLGKLGPNSSLSAEDKEHEFQNYIKAQMDSWTEDQRANFEKKLKDKFFSEETKEVLSEKSFNILKRLNNLGDSFLSIPSLINSIFQSSGSTDEEFLLDPSPIMAEVISGKTQEEIEKFFTELNKISVNQSNYFDSLSDSGKLYNVYNAIGFIRDSINQIVQVSIETLTKKFTGKSEDMTVALDSMIDALIHHKFTTEDLLFTVILEIVYAVVGKSVNITVPPELVKAIEEFGLTDPAVVERWRTDFFKRIAEEAKEFIQDNIDKPSSTKSTPNPKQPNFERITEQEFVEAGNDGSRKVVGKKKVDVNPSDSKQSKTPFLDRYGEDLCEKARNGKIDPLIGRDKEINSLFEILCNRKKKSAALVGKAGCGKTSIVEYLAQLIVKGKVPDKLKNVRLVSLPIFSIKAGASLRGELEGRLEGIIKEILNSDQKIILYMDEMHQFGSGVDGNTISDVLKPYLANGSITLIGSTTDSEFRKYVENDRAMVRRFSKIIVEEPSLEETVEILKKSMDNYSTTHKVQYSDEVIEFAVRVGGRYLHDNANPDLSLGILDRAGSACELSHKTAYKKLKKQIKDLEVELNDLTEKRTTLVFESTSDPSKLDEINTIQPRIDEIEKELAILKDPKKADKSTWPTVSIKDVATVISNAANVPVNVILEPEIDKLAKLKEEISEVVIGQDEAVDTMARALCRSYLGLRNPKRPIASFMFIGPTGVGKTELAKKTAEIVFGTEEAFLRIDGGEYSQPHTDTKLLGAPPSFVGYGTTPPVFDKIRKRPYTLVLVDEVEKIHPDIVNKVFLSILDEGVVTLSDQTKVDMRNCVIVFTGNVGSTTANKVSFNFTETETDKVAARKAAYMNALKGYFRPEFLGRLTEVVCFNQLTSTEMRSILELEINKFKEKSGKTLSMTDELKDYLISKVDYKLGARNLSVVIQKEIEDKIADAILNNKKLFKKMNIEADYKDGEVKVNFK